MVLSYFSDITCGEGCWTAKEDVCKCSCNGKNHGILLTPDGKKPKRTSKIQGCMYELKGIGKYSEIYRQAEETNKNAGPYRIDKFKLSCYAHPDKCTPDCEPIYKEYKYYYSYAMKGSPAKVKVANKQQIEKWAELENYKNMNEDDLYRNSPYLLWVKVETVNNNVDKI